MAVIEMKVMRLLEWELDDMLQLIVGSEGAADLANSTPAGGTVVKEIPVFQGDMERGGLGLDPLGEAPLGYSQIGYGLGQGELGYGSLGINDIPRAVISTRYTPTDKCETLPVGVRIKDAAGNTTTVCEEVVQLCDAPVGARNVTVTDTGSINEARLTWDASPDI